MGFQICLTLALFVCLSFSNDVLGKPYAGKTAKSLSAGDSCGSLTFVTRDEWNARTPKGREDMPGPLGCAVVHHTATQQCTTLADCSQEMRSFQNYHMDGHGWDDIGYNLVIGGDERVYMGRGWDTVGAHAGSTFYNYNSPGIAVIGDYTSALPSSGVLQVLNQLMECGIELGHLTDQYQLRGHTDVRETGSTSCPGDTLYAEIQTWLHYTSTYGTVGECPE